MNLRLTGRRVLIKTDKADDRTASGILLKSNDRSKECYGTVVSTGDECPDAVSVGEHVIYEKFAGAEITLQDEQYLIMNFDDLIAVIGE